MSASSGDGTVETPRRTAAVSATGEDAMSACFRIAAVAAAHAVTAAITSMPAALAYPLPDAPDPGCPPTPAVAPVSIDTPGRMPLATGFIAALVLTGLRLGAAGHRNRRHRFASTAAAAPVAR